MEAGRQGADGGDVLVVALDIKRGAAEGFCVRGELFVLIEQFSGVSAPVVDELVVVREGVLEVAGRCLGGGSVFVFEPGGEGAKARDERVVAGVMRDGDAGAVGRVEVGGPVLVQLAVGFTP